jgi:hypothetical protein
MRRFAKAILLLSLLGVPVGASAGPEKKSAVEELTSIWISACLDGQLRLVPGRIREVSADEIEISERRQKNTRYFEILKPAKAGLFITDYDPPSHQGFKSWCELASTGRDLKSSWRSVMMAVAAMPGKPVPGIDIYTIDNPAAGYRIEVHYWMIAIGHYSDRIVARARAKARKATVSGEESPFE